MIDRSDPAAWAPAMISVGIVGLVLIILAAVSYSVARRLRVMDEKLVAAAVERSGKQKRRATKSARLKALHEVEERRDMIERYHRAGGLLCLGAYGAVAADVVVSLVFWSEPVVFIGATIGAAAVGALMYVALTKRPKFPPVPKDIA